MFLNILKPINKINTRVTVTGKYSGNNISHQLQLVAIVAFNIANINVTDK